MQHARPNRLRRAVIYAALATLLGVVSLTLSQCTMVGDNLTGVDLTRGRPTTCLKMCNDFWNLVFEQEQKFHDQAKLLCDAAKCAELPQPDQAECIAERQACQAAESDRHALQHQLNSQGKSDCQNNCHNQGTGTAG